MESEGTFAGCFQEESRIRRVASSTMRPQNGLGTRMDRLVCYTSL